MEVLVEGLARQSKKLVFSVRCRDFLPFPIIAIAPMVSKYQLTTVCRNWQAGPVLLSAAVEVHAVVWASACAVYSPLSQ